jgi:hypothetical protein
MRNTGSTGLGSADFLLFEQQHCSRTHILNHDFNYQWHADDPYGQASSEPQEPHVQCPFHLLLCVSCALNMFNSKHIMFVCFSNSILLCALIQRICCGFLLSHEPGLMNITQITSFASFISHCFSAVLHLPSTGLLQDLFLPFTLPLPIQWLFLCANVVYPFQSYNGCLINFRIMFKLLSTVY